MIAMANGVGASTVTSVSDRSELITGEAVALDVRPASFILRAAGTAIDVVVTLVVGVVLFLVLVTIAGETDMDLAALQAFSIVVLVTATIAFPTAIELLTRGRSIGKIAVGVRIVRDDGGATGFRHAFIRALVGFFEIYMTLGGGAALVGLLGDRSKRIGDILAGCYAQHERVPRIVLRVEPLPPAMLGWAGVADVGRMPDRLSRRIAQFVSQFREMTPVSRTALAAELAGEASAYVSPLPDVDPVTFLLSVAAVRRDRSYRALMLERERLDRLSPVLTGNPHGFPER